MRVLISHIILPLPILWIMIALAFILYKRRKKTSRIVMGSSLLWLLIISTPFVPDFLVKSLENRYSAVSSDILKNIKGPVNILVLGGGHTNDERLPANSQLVESSIARLTEGIRVHRLLPKSTLITSGHSGNKDIPHAIVLASTALLLGVDSSSIKMQETPENTWQEATNYKLIFGGSTSLILVTSAAHMPRAMILFHKAGLNPVAAPANFLVKNEKKKDFFFWVPSSGNIEKMESAIHEYVGLLWYMVGGS